MQLEHIILFSKIAREKSISKVAANSHISQPALSQQMQRLEEEVGQKLFERSNRGIELTHAGVIMEKYATQFMQVYSNFRQDMDNLQSNFGTVRIAATPVAANYALPCSLFKVKHRFPDNEFSLIDVCSQEVIQQVLGGNADIGFVVGRSDNPGLICREAFSDKIYLVAKSDYYVPEAISMEELRRLPLIMLGESSGTYRLVCDYLTRQGYDVQKFNVAANLGSTESVKSAVLAQHGLAFLPYMAIKKEIYQKQLKIINLKNFDLNCDVYSIHRPKEAVDNDELFSIIKYFITTVTKSIC
ncbi:MAG: LysR family transcriptional regulator [Angelakisella sp.]